MEQRGYVLPPAGPKQNTGMAQSKLTSHVNPGEERVKGNQDYYSSRTPSPWKQETREKWIPAFMSRHYPRTVIPKVGTEAPLDPLRLAFVSMGKFVLMILSDVLMFFFLL